MLVSLEESTSKHRQLNGRRYSEVDCAVIEPQLASSKFIGSGSFCRVWQILRWNVQGPSFDKPVAIKVCSAAFKQGLGVQEMRNKHAQLKRHWYREINAHLLLQGQPRVVKVYHIFQGTMMVPAVPGKDESDQGPCRMKVLGLVEELCSERSLFSFCWSVQHIPVKHALWPLHHIASEFAALMEQVEVMDEMGLVHQDIKTDNILVTCGRGRWVDIPKGGASLPLLKLGDLNGVQWQSFTLDGTSWIGTVGFMPHRVRQLYLGLQQAGPDVGETNYDTYQMGKTLMRVLLDLHSVKVDFVKKGEDMAAEDMAVKTATLELLARPVLPGEPVAELWVFGVAICLHMAWDGSYDSPDDLLRMLPGDAAWALKEWGRLCAVWKRAPAAYWGDAGNQRAMAELYLRLAELAHVAPLDEPWDPEVHVQEDELLVEVFCNFWDYGDQSEERLGPVKQQAAAILQEWRDAQETAAAEEAAAAAAAALAQEAAGNKWGGRDRPSYRSTAWEQKVAERSEKEQAWLEGSSSMADENAAYNGAGRGGGRKRKAATTGEAAGKRQKQQKQHKRKGKGEAAAAQGEAAKVKPAAAKAKPAKAAAAAVAAHAESEELGSQDDTLVLSTKLRLKDVWGNTKPPGAHAPQLLGDKHCVAVMLGETMRVAAAMTEHGCVTLQLSAGCRVSFSKQGRSVQFSRREVRALAADPRACQRWNTFVGSALQAWLDQGKEGSQAQRLALLQPLQAAA